MVKNKKRIQCLIFKKKCFPTRRCVKKWVCENGYKVDNRLKQPIFDTRDGYYRVIQRKCDYFSKSSLEEEKLGNGVKGVFGNLKK